MVNKVNNKLEEIVSFFGLEVQNEMKVFVQTHTNSKCDTQFSYNSFLGRPRPKIYVYTTKGYVAPKFG